MRLASGAHCVWLAVLGGGVAIGIGCSKSGEDVITNPSCAADLSILAIDGAATGAGDGGANASGTDGGVTSGRDGGTVYAPCAVDDTGGGGGESTGSSDDSGVPGVVVCPSYTCVCDDTTTQTASDSDPATGACYGESQVCEIICTAHGGWM